MIVPSVQSKHVIQICKGHHEQTTALDGIRHFVSRWCGIDIENVSSNSMYSFLLEAMSEILTKEDLLCFIRDIFRFDTKVDYRDIMIHMISSIAVTKVRENGNILIDLSLDEQNTEMI